MKKSLFALATVGAFAGAAQAQSSVTVYGIMDAGYATVTNTTAAGGSTNGLQTGGMAASRLGFRGTEDLGGGLRAGFVMETELNTANGQATGLATATPNGTQAFNTGQFLNRQSFVSLASKEFGEIRLGLSNTATYDYQIRFEPLKAANLGGYLNTSSTTAPSNYTNGPAYNQQQSGNRGNNAISYLSPTFAGLQFRFLTGEGQAAGGQNLYAGNPNNLRLTDFGLSYNWGKLDVAATYRTVGASGSAAAPSSAGATSTTGVYGMYDFGVVKPYAIYNISKKTTPGVSTTVTGYSFISKMVGLEAPITKTVSIGAQYTQNVNGNVQTGAVSGQSSAVGALAKYSLSKRTSLYAIGAWSQNGGSGAQLTSTSKFTGATQPIQFGGTGNMQDQQAYMLGVNHTF
jgi:predicted porin